MFNKCKKLSGQNESLTNVLSVIDRNFLPLVQEFYSLENPTDIFFILDKNSIIYLIESIVKLEDKQSLLCLLNFLYKRDRFYSLWINGELNISESLIHEVAESCQVKSLISFRDDLILVSGNSTLFHISGNSEINRDISNFCKKTDIDKICSSSSFLVSLSIYGKVSVYPRNNDFEVFLSNISERIIDVACTNSSLAVLLESGKVFVINEMRVSESISSNNVRLICSESNIVAIRQNSTFEVYIDFKSNVRISQNFREYNHNSNSIFCGKLFTICLTGDDTYRLINIRQDIEVKSKESISEISANGTYFMILSSSGILTTTNILDMKKVTYTHKRFNKISCGENGNHVAISNDEIYSINSGLNLISYEREQFTENLRYNKIKHLISGEIENVFSSGNYNLITTKGSRMFLLKNGQRKVF